MSNLDIIETEINTTIKASLGTPVDVVVEVIEQLISEGQGADANKAKFAKVALKACFMSSTNVRGAVVTSGADRVLTTIPVFLITGNRAQKDNVNFSAVRLAGHILNAVSTDALAAKLNAKAGNIFTGAGFTEGPAGKINRETALSLTKSDKDAYATFSASLSEKDVVFLNSLYKSVSA